MLNQVVDELLEGHPVSDVKLKEVLGHTPLQVGRAGRSAGLGLGAAGTGSAGGRLVRRSLPRGGGQTSTHQRRRL